MCPPSSLSLSKSRIGHPYTFTNVDAFVDLVTVGKKSFFGCCVFVGFGLYGVIGVVEWNLLLS
jgi:hypothetical protein